MNQIQAPPYQPSFNHPHGVYPQQQPHFASHASVPAPQHFQPSPSPLSQSHTQQSFGFPPSQSPLVSPSAQDFHPQTNPTSPSLFSPLQQQHSFQYFQQANANGASPNIGAQNDPSSKSTPTIPSPGHADLPPTQSVTFGTSATNNTPTPSSTQPPQRHQQSGSTSPQKFPMAAPPLPASVQRQQSPASANSSGASQPSSPRGSASSILERQRVAMLLDINLALLEDMSKIMAQGRGGAVNPQQAAMFKSQGLPDKMASEEFSQSYYRLQANLAYLYSQPDMQALNPQNKNQPQSGNKGPAHPPHFVHAPSHIPSLEEKYGALRKLFPGWAGKDAPGAAGGQASTAA